MAALRLSGVCKSYDGRVVLHDIDLTVEAGETVGVLGANGSGKSTLLRLVATLARPDAGTVEVCGVAAADKPETARRHLSILTQDAPTYAELTPHEHLAWWSRAQGLRLAPATIEAATVESGLGHAAHKPAGTLSRGQRQRLALAMALLPDRALLVLDEPTTALDTEGRRWLETRLATRRGAALMALHDAGEADRLCDRVIRLDGGRLA